MEQRIPVNQLLSIMQGLPKRPLLGQKTIHYTLPLIKEGNSINDTIPNNTEKYDDVLIFEFNENENQWELLLTM